MHCLYLQAIEGIYLSRKNASNSFYWAFELVRHFPISAFVQNLIMYRSEYIALVGSFVLVGLESIIRILTLALRMFFLPFWL